MKKLRFALGIALLVPVMASAQEMGDSIRLYVKSELKPLDGRLLTMNRDSIRLRQFAGDRTVRTAEVSKVRVWKKNSPAAAMLIGVVASAGTAAILLANSDHDAVEPIKGQVMAASVSSGVLIGVVSYLLVPAQWRGGSLPK